MSIPEITPLPAPPNRLVDTGAAFSEKYVAHAEALAPWTDEVNAVGAAIEAAASDVSQIAADVDETVAGVDAVAARTAVLSALANGFTTYADLEAFAPHMANGDTTTVAITDTGTHGASIPNAGRYVKQSGSLVRVGDTDGQIALTSAASIAATANRVGERVIGPVVPDATGTAFSNSASYFWPTAKATYDQFIDKLEIGLASAGALSVIVARHETDSTLSLVSATPLLASNAGSAVFDDLAIAVPPGCVAGIKFDGASGYYSPGTIPNGETAWTVSGVVGSHTAYSASVVNGVHFRFTLSGETSGKARAAYALANTVQDQIGTEITAGWPSPVDTGSDAPSGYSIVMQTPSPGDGVVSQAVIGVAAPKAVAVVVVEMDLTTLAATVVSSTSVSLSAGVNTVPLSIPILAGQYVGVVGGLKFQNSVNPQGVPVWQKGSALVSGDVLSSSTLHRFEAAFAISTGLYAQKSSGNADPSGLNALASADPTGVADATAAFAAAKASHPNPYVPAGNYAVTALPANGGGFWGPGKIRVKGKRFFIPRAAELGSLYERVRQRLSEHAAAANVLSLVGDSIAHFAYAGTGAQHFGNLLTSFLNHGVSPGDEPGMTALRSSSSYTPAFYGVAFTGTVTTGTAGPIHESAIMAPGATMTFTGTYETIGLFFEQEAGAGSLVIKRGSTTLSTISAAGATEHDKFTGAIATGTTASATYTIEVTGAPVNVTGLVRLGIKAPGSMPRLLVNRCAHGSYTWSDWSTPERRASVAKQAAWAGGKVVPIYALGINDSFGTPPATIVATASAVIDDFAALGAPEQFGILPIRPTSAWDANYTGGRTFTTAQGALARLYREKGVTVLPMPVDFAGEGLLEDGLHPGAAGNDIYVQCMIEAWR